MMMIMPLLKDDLDESQVVELKKKISEDNDISYRTVSRYLAAYQEEGFSGLKPKVCYKRPSNKLPENFDEVLEHAIILRREVPKRSVNDIIRILELEGIIKDGTVHRSTLQRHLQSAGFGAKQIKIYSQKGAAARRFQKPHRMMLLQADIKYGPHLPIGKNGAMKQVYLSAFIDDATRYIVSAKFYNNQRVEIIEDSLRTAIMNFGKPQKIFVDNGKQYRSEWLGKACNRLGIKLSFSKPYHPEGKGKIEYFNKRVGSFLSEVALDKPTTLEELNKALDIWIKEYYHKNPHSGLDGLTPEVAFRGDKRALKFAEDDELREAFLHTEERTVDKIGCISFGGKKYEVGMHLIGRAVDVYYDPTWTNEVEIHHNDFTPFKAKQQVIGENCYSKAKLPDAVTPLTSNGSRLLKALGEKEQKHPAAISFKNLTGGEDRV